MITKPLSFGATPSQEVLDFHQYSDVDSDYQAQHHTLGLGPLQAAPGNHNHDARHGRYDLEHAHDVEDLLVSGDSSWGHTSRLSRFGRNISLTISVTTAVPQGAGNVSVVVPAIHRPMGVIVNKYFGGYYVNTGNPIALYFDSIGRVVSVIGAVAAGDGYVGHISYIARFQ